MILGEKRGYRKLKKKAPDLTLENSLWGRLSTCRQADNRMNVTA
jgi:hypothetical protein